MLSHKQLPKMLIKNFITDGKVFYYDIKKDDIGYCGPNKIGTELDYFDDRIENLLNKKVETEFGKTVSIIKKAVKRKLPITINEKMVKSTIKYIDICKYRSNLAFETVRESSYVISCFEARFQRDIIMDLTINNYSPKQSMYARNKISIIVNNTHRNFITNRLSYYEIQSNYTTILIIPIDPKIAICLAPLDYNKENNLLIIDDDQDVCYMNNIALEYEIEFNNDFIISNNKKELMLVKQNRNKNIKI